MRFDCRKCPLYEACDKAHKYVYGGSIVSIEASSYEECELYQMCADAVNKVSCLIFELEEARLVLED